MGSIKNLDCVMVTQSILSNHYAVYIIYGYTIPGNLYDLYLTGTSKMFELDTAACMNNVLE